MKTFAPRALHGGMLRDILADLAVTPAQVAKYLDVTERSVWRWLADENAPRSALLALWHLTPNGLQTVAVDVGNALAIERGLTNAHKSAHERETGRLARLVAIADTGAANDPLLDGPVPWHGPSIRVDCSDAPAVTADYLRRRN